MADQRRGGIAWTDETWNPIRGCSRVSEGCRNCYAERQAARFIGSTYAGLVKIHVSKPDGVLIREPRWTGEVRLVEDALAHPLGWRKPRHIFVNSMSDLFHEKVPDEWIGRIVEVMGAAQHHTFQVLTKRPVRMRDFLARNAEPGGQLVTPLENVWWGVSVENQTTADERIPLLLQTPAAVRFVSYEPALGPVDFDSEHKDGLHAMGCGHEGGWRECKAEFGGDERCNGIDWLIVGGESGPKARRFNVAWARPVLEQCRAANVACFIKQLGSFVVDRNDAGFTGWEENSWPDGTEIEEHINGYREEYQGAPVRVRLRDRAGADPAEWPEDLRVREWPR